MIKLYYRKLRLWNSFRKLRKAELKKTKAFNERIWIEENEHIHILNYPYYKIKRIMKHE